MLLLLSCWQTGELGHESKPFCFACPPPLLMKKKKKVAMLFSVVRKHFFQAFFDIFF